MVSPRAYGRGNELIALDDVSKRYPNGTQALRDVDLSIDSGDFVFLVGSSGAGKSTLIRLLIREEVPSSGKVWVDGQDVVRMRRSHVPRLRRKVGVVFQDFKLLPTRTVAENVAFALLVTGHSGDEVREETDRVLSLVGLAQRRDHFPDQLSAGEQQRTAMPSAPVSVMPLLFAFFFATDRWLQAAVGILESKVELGLFLEDDAKVSDILALKARIEADPAVARVDYVTKDQALARLVAIAERRPDLAIEDVGPNPLPASLEIKLARAQEAARVGALLREELGNGVVYDVVDNPSVVDKLLTITRVLSIGGVAVLGIMLFVALFVIVNTIRIAVHARRDEIEIMKLVGASDWFVRWPFILEGMLVGALGAAASLTVLFLASGAVTSSLLAFLDILPVSFGPTFLAELAATVVGIALVVGGGGATWAVRSHLAKRASP